MSSGIVVENGDVTVSKTGTTGHCPELVAALRAQKERPFTLQAAAIR